VLGLGAEGDLQARGRRCVAPRPAEHDSPLRHHLS